MLRLRHDSFTGDQGEVPEVVLINSHDRSSAYRVFSGVMRFVCENGMIVQSSDFGSFSIRHSGNRYLCSQIMAATSQVMEGVPAIMGRIADWKETSCPGPFRSTLPARPWNPSRTRTSRRCGS